MGTMTWFVLRLCGFAAVIEVQCVQFSLAAPNHTFSFGTVEGVDVESADGALLYAYYGIPYAKPPIGDYRFLPPEPYSNTDENMIISYPTYRNSCIQFPETEPMDEDCLHLNVFVPAVIPEDVHCHVMLYIHGGGYTTGSAAGAVPTEMVAAHDVIVVTANYRLGFLGFLSTNDEVAPGNNGLRDIVTATKWVKDNIWMFQGNGSDITIFGHGSGGSAASLLALSPESKGLFTKVVMMSGTAVAPTALVSKDRNAYNLKILAESLHCYPWYCLFWCYDSQNLHINVLDCMRQKEARDFHPYYIMESSHDFGTFFGVFETLYAGPTCDGIFLPNAPEKLLKNLTYLEETGVTSRAYISGSTNEEGVAAVVRAMFDQPETFLTSQNMRKVAEDAAKFIYPKCTRKEVVNLIDFMYSYPRERSPNPRTQNYVDLVTDSLYTYPSVEFLTLLSQTSPATKSYMYLFNTYPEVKDNFTDVNNTTVIAFDDDDPPRPVGTVHGQDLLYLLDKLDIVNDTDEHIDLNTSDARAVMSVYRGALAAFAKTGDPSLPGAEWPSFDEGCRRYLAIQPQPQAGKRVFPMRMSLWQDYLPKVVEILWNEL